MAIVLRCDPGSPVDAVEQEAVLVNAADVEREGRVAEGRAGLRDAIEHVGFQRPGGQHVGMLGRGRRDFRVQRQRACVGICGQDHLPGSQRGAVGSGQLHAPARGTDRLDGRVLVDPHILVETPLSQPPRKPVGLNAHKLVGHAGACRVPDKLGHLFLLEELAVQADCLVALHEPAKGGRLEAVPGGKDMS